MSRIALVAATPEVEQAFTVATKAALLVLPGPPPANIPELIAQLNDSQLPEIVVLDAQVDPEASLGLAERIQHDWPSVVVLMVTDRPNELALSALRAGVRDLLPPTVDVATARGALTRAEQTRTQLHHHMQSQFDQQHEPTQEHTPTGRVITVVSPKGGVGKTTMATNLAVALASAVSHSTVLVDLDLQFGDVATALNLTPEHHLQDALASAASGDTIALKTRLTLHESGLYVLPAPEHPAIADSISSSQINQLLQILTEEFDYVVVDTSPGLSDHTLGALDQTTDPLLLTALNVPGANGLRKVVDTLSVLQMFTDRYHVVVNFADQHHGMTPKDISATLGVPVSTSIPTSKSAPISLNTGEPLMQTQPRDPLIKALLPLINTLLPIGVTFDKRGRLEQKGQHRS